MKHKDRKKDDAEAAQGNRPLRAILAALSTDRDEERFQHSLLELAGLCEACGMEAVDVLTQRAEHPDHATYLGSGKVEELKGALYALQADLVIFDRSLSPLQVRNLVRILDTEVIDRTDLILRIFSERARTKEARLQVEYARLDYLLPRLVGMRENLSRQGGTAGFHSARGAGETQLELDRRRILNRQAQLRKELKEVERVRETQGESRLASGVLRIGLIGYTNAGKSTLMNRLLAMSGEDTHGTERGVFAEDMLFATLDTTVRRIAVKGHEPFLLSDTVGLIHDLPASLVKAFRATLKEASQADLLLEVTDCADADHKAQQETTRLTLQEIGAATIPRIRVMNKADLSTTPGHAPGTIRRANDPVGIDEVYISAKSGEGISELLGLIDEVKNGVPEEYSVLIPYAEGGRRTQILETMEVLEEEFLEEGVRIRVRCGKKRALLPPLEVKQRA